MKLIQKSVCWSGLFLVLLIAACTKSYNHQESETEIRVTDTPQSSVSLFEIKIANAYFVHESEAGYLERMKLKSMYYAEVDGNIEDTMFKQLSNTLLSTSDVKNIQGEVVDYKLFTDHAAASNLNLGIDNVSGFSITAYAATGLNHYYFKKDGNTYTHVQKLDNTTTVPYSFQDSRLLHFASFSSVPDASGIVVLRKAINATQTAQAKSWAKDKLNTLLNDTIYSDPDLNAGVAYLDNSPDGGTSCGGACANVPNCGASQCICTSTAEDPLTHFCKAIKSDGGCLGFKATELAKRTNNESFIVDILRFRQFDNEYLMGSDLGKKYLKYIPVLDANLRLDKEAMQTYMDVFPNLYQMMDTLTDREVDSDTIVITSELYDKAIKILDEYAEVEDADFRAMSSQMRQDLGATKGMSKSKIEAWINQFKAS